MDLPPPLKQMAGAIGRLALRGFLDAGGTLDLTPPSPPVVSTLVLACNRAEVTLACFRSLAQRLNRTPFEVIVIDNGSSDETSELLDRVRGLRVIRNAANAGFPKGVNQAAAVARGEYLLLLNNDTEVFGNSIDVAANHLAAHPDVGAAGGRIVLLDGRLQEAGCVVWRDGWVDQHGRGGDPDDPQFGFERDVDYCSGAFLLTRRAVFEELGGLDEGFSPGYFEDVDFAVKLWRSGRRVVYLPGVAVLHHEGATSSILTDANALFRKHLAIFAERHRDWLRHQPARDPERLNTFPFRLAADATTKVFVLAEDSAELDAVSALVNRLRAAEGFATLGVFGAFAEVAKLRTELPTTEIVPFANAEALQAFLAGRATSFDLALVTGNTNVAALRSAGLAVLRWDGSRAVPTARE